MTAPFKLLIVEDEYLLADQWMRALQEANVAILGPAPSVRAALAMVASTPDIGGAILDINLTGCEKVFLVAAELRRRGLNFVFTTGYDKADIPAEFSSVPRYEKPVNVATIVAELRQAAARPA